jgi:hypothetical protein
MAFGIWKDFLIVRMDKDQAAQSLKDKNTKPFDITGMAGWVMVKEAGWKNKAALEKWIGMGKQFASSLPDKKAKAKKTKTLRDINPVEQAKFLTF